MKRTILIILTLFFLITLSWSQDQYSEIRNQDLIGCEISYARPEGSGELRPYRLEIYNKERDEIVIKGRNKVLKKITWVENDSMLLKYTYGYYQSNNFHILEAKEKGKLFSTQKLLPLEDGRKDYFILTEVEEENIAEYPIDFPLDLNEVMNFIPITYEMEDCLMLIKIGAIDTLNGNNRILTGTYNCISKASISGNRSIYKLSELKIKSFELDEGYVEYIYDYLNSKNQLKIRSKRAFDKHHNLVISYSLDQTVPEKIYQREYSYDEHGNWKSMKAYHKNRIVEEINRYFIYSEE